MVCFHIGDLLSTIHNDSELSWQNSQDGMWRSHVLEQSVTRVTRCWSQGSSSQACQPRSLILQNMEISTELRNVIVTTWEENIWEKLWTDWVLCYLVRRWWTGDMEHVTNKRHCACLEAIANIDFSPFILFRGSCKLQILHFYVYAFKSICFMYFYNFWSWCCYDQ